MAYFIFALFVLVGAIDHASGLVPNTNIRARKVGPPRTLLHSTTIGIGTYADSLAKLSTDSIQATEANQFRADLESADLAECHGILHASGCRRLSDVRLLSLDQINDIMGKDVDASQISTVFHNIPGNYQNFGNNNAQLSTIIDEIPFAPNVPLNFEVVSAEHDIFKGRLFTPEQCHQLKRLAEYHAYQVNPEWIGMSGKSIQGFNSMVESKFQQLFNELYSLFPGTFVQGSIRFESDNEPHLVRYIGDKSGAPLHVDTDHKSITINVLLSDNDDFGGGGTYLKDIDQIIKLEPGEVLIHPGNLQHAGVDTTFGLRYLLVAFLECEWEDASLNENPRGNGLNLL